MVSLAQTALFGTTGIILGNLVTKGGPGGTSKGLHLGWDPTVAVIVAILVTTVIGLIGGAVASRSAGIYFLMITLTYSVIAATRSAQVTKISGFSRHRRDQRLHARLASATCSTTRTGSTTSRSGSRSSSYALIRYLVRTPFGITLQGVRDEPVRMASLGYDVPLHRTLAFGFGAFLAAIAGILYALVRRAGRSGRRRPPADHQPADHRRDRRAAPDRGRLDRRIRLLRHAERRSRRRPTFRCSGSAERSSAGASTRSSGSSSWRS